MSGDPEQEYFVDGITEDVITNLSLWKTFPVISRNSSFTYKGKSVNLKEVSIGHALISDALNYGMENTVNLYLRALKK